MVEYRQSRAEIADLAGITVQLLDTRRDASRIFTAQLARQGSTGADTVDSSGEASLADRTKRRRDSEMWWPPGHA